MTRGKDLPTQCGQAGRAGVWVWTLPGWPWGGCGGRGDGTEEHTHAAQDKGRGGGHVATRWNMITGHSYLRPSTHARTHTLTTGAEEVEVAAGVVATGVGRPPPPP